MIRSKCASFAVVVCLVAGSLVIATIPVFAQTVVNPIIVTFTASSDQDATTSSGAPLLTSYELEFYMSGATQPFQTVGLGKPTPDGSNAIAVNFATLLSPVPPLGVVYTASVAAVGPGGRSSSPLSVDTFSFTGGTSPCTFGVSPAGILVPSTWRHRVRDSDSTKRLHVDSERTGRLVEHHEWRQRLGHRHHQLYRGRKYDGVGEKHDHNRGRQGGPRHRGGAATGHPAGSARHDAWVVGRSSYPGMQ